MVREHQILPGHCPGPWGNAGTLNRPRTSADFRPCDGVLASDLTWVVVRVEDSLTAALQAVKGGDLNGTVDMWTWLQ